MDRDSPLPLWAQLLDDLKARIASGEFVSRFPTDKEMIEQYSVSRQTVREAVRRLEQDGVVVRHRGRGTVLTETRFEQQLGTLYSLFRELEKSGRHQSSKVLIQESVRNAELAPMFHLRETDEFFHLERVRYADTLEVAIDNVFIPMKYASPLLDVNFEHTALYDELEKLCHICPTKGEERLSPIILGDTESKLLGTESTLAAYLILRSTFVGDQMLEYRETIIRGDRYCFISSFDTSKPTTSSNISAEIN